MVSISADVHFISSEVDSISSEVDSISSEVDVLNSKQIVEDFSWSNPEEITVGSYGCLDEFQVGANETVDFSANMFTVWGGESRAGNFWIGLKKDGQEIAWDVDNNDLSNDYYWQNISVSLRHREKLHDQAATFQLCYTVDSGLRGLVVHEGWFQYGYQRYGTGHAM